MSKKDLGEMSFLDHLEILRWVLIRSSLAIVIGASISFFFLDFIFDVIIFGPKDPNFVTYRFFCEIGQMFGATEDLCIKELNFEIQSRKMGTQFSTAIWMGITVGFILGFPYILWEVWKFIRPALHENEKKNAKWFIIIASLLFFVGVLFGYYMLAPLSINFLGNFSVSNQVSNEFDIDSYIGTIKTCILASGLIFELPILMYFLGKLGIIDAPALRKYRKIAIVLIFIIAAIITPPDVVSQVVVAIPLLILYEISIYVVKWVTKKEKKK
ncbi:MAG: twin-arginine translocase subunit TatC [Flavobacteriaceae bacterium]